MSAPENPYLIPWKQATWRKRIRLLCFWFVMWGIVMPATFIAVFMVLGMMMDTAAQRSSELSRCQKNADTPYEYHQCK